MTNHSVTNGCLHLASLVWASNVRFLLLTGILGLTCQNSLYNEAPQHTTSTHTRHFAPFSGYGFILYAWYPLGSLPVALSVKCPKSASKLYCEKWHPGYFQYNSWSDLWYGPQREPQRFPGICFANINKSEPVMSRYLGFVM